ncbi:MAG: AraC family transcriptional regulator [Spirochaetales bacterium]|nr:AraC family transcriptional regulator [Spirochaetales bacterium]
MRELLMELMPREDFIQSDIDGLDLFRRDKGYEPKPLIYKPHIIILAQGRKNLYWGDQTISYDAEHYFALTVPLPVVCEAVIREGEPMLGFSLKIDPRIIGEILVEMESEPLKRSAPNNSLYQAPLSEEIIDASVRLLETLKSGNEAKILGPIYMKEILFKILNGENGGILKDLAYNNRSLSQIARVINMIHNNYSQAMDVQTMAEEAGMSSSSFHSSFKEVTSTSPLQYIKNIRLHKAKELIQQEGEKAYAAAMQVGYESSSQFNREYKRLFGVTPAKDIVETPRI